MNRFLNAFLVFFVPATGFAMGRAPGSAEGQAAGPYSGFLAIVPWLMIFGVFYFLLIRPQQKQAKAHQEMIDSLKRGDNILTQGGLYGMVIGIKGSIVEVKLNEEVKVRIDKSAVTRVIREDLEAVK
jgi:preprotein translocase subunit YajC